MISYGHDHVTCSSKRIQRRCRTTRVEPWCPEKPMKFGPQPCADWCVPLRCCWRCCVRWAKKSRPLHPWWEKHESIGTWTACHFQKGFSNMDGQNHYSRRLQIYIYIKTYHYFWHLLNSLCLLRKIITQQASVTFRTRVWRCVNLFSASADLPESN